MKTWSSSGRTVENGLRLFSKFSNEIEVEFSKSIHNINEDTHDDKIKEHEKMAEELGQEEEAEGTFQNYGESFKYGTLT